jgi:hypothetical protein
MRLYTVVPGVLPRVVPPKGAFVQSHFLPGGVRFKTLRLYLLYFAYYQCRQLFLQVIMQSTTIQASLSTQRILIQSDGWAHKVKNLKNTCCHSARALVPVLELSRSFSELWSSTTLFPQEVLANLYLPVWHG